MDREQVVAGPTANEGINPANGYPWSVITDEQKKAWHDEQAAAYSAAHQDDPYFRLPTQEARDSYRVFFAQKGNLFLGADGLTHATQDGSGALPAASEIARISEYWKAAPVAAAASR